jgi:hypothetical protein
MRTAPLVASLSTLLLAASTAAASVSEPNGTAVPQASPDPVQLNTLFTSLGEPVDWKVDAASTPNAFSPLCGFTAKFLLHGADCPLDFAWYNETGQPPAASDLHVVIPAGSPVGATFTGTDIKSDPAYLGGLVGFAIVGNFSQFCTQTHYSNPKWNQTCTSCNPQAPWITTLVYPSKTASAFYLAFEDGPTSSFAFNNDGDFNDDVYIVTGVTCLGGGEPCMTTKPGICAAGVTQCTAQGTICQQLSQPATEKCDGLDDDCNGQVDEGDICPTGYLCDKGTCVENCQVGEFKCPLDKVCSTDGHCVDPGCQSVTCDAGKVCVGGVCKGPCDGVVCPYDQVLSRRRLRRSLRRADLRSRAGVRRRDLRGQVRLPALRGEQGVRRRERPLRRSRMPRQDVRRGHALRCRRLRRRLRGRRLPGGSGVQNGAVRGGAGEPEQHRRRHRVDGRRLQRRWRLADGHEHRERRRSRWRHRRRRHRRQRKRQQEQLRLPRRGRSRHRCSRLGGDRLRGRGREPAAPPSGHLNHARAAHLRSRMIVRALLRSPHPAFAAERAPW